MRYIYQAMNLIDLYGDPSRGREEESFIFTPAPTQRKEVTAPLLLLSVRDRLLQQHPNDHVTIVHCQDIATHSKMSFEHVLQYIEKRPYAKIFQFYFEVGFNPVLNLLSIRGNYLQNGLFLHLQSREQQMMALRMAANINPEISPLKMTVNSVSGELLLQHSSFIDTALADMKFKRNLVNLTFRVTFIIELLMKYRTLLLFYSGYRDVVRKEDLPSLRGVEAVGEKIDGIEGILKEICLRSYDSRQRVDNSLRRDLMKDHCLHFRQDFQQVLNIFQPKNQNPSIRCLSHLANEHYSREQLHSLVTKQDEKFDFRASLKVQMGKIPEYHREQIGGNGIVFSVTAKFKVIDEEHLRRHPQAVHTPYEERLAMKVDRNRERQSKVAREIQVISSLGESCHPNMPTFFLEDRPQDCLLTLWEQNLSLQHYLQKYQVSMYHLILMLEQSAKALCFLHRNGIVHCDFKPANLILCRRFLVRIIDFGQAETSQERRGRPGRTFPFAGPQAYTRGAITPALDVYSLGVTIYKCLFGGFMWGVLLKKLKRIQGGAQVLPWIMPERFRDAGEYKIALVLACLSLKCTAYLPQDRPKLPWIVTVLQECRKFLADIYYR